MKRAASTPPGRRSPTRAQAHLPCPGGPTRPRQEGPAPTPGPGSGGIIQVKVLTSQPNNEATAYDKLLFKKTFPFARAFVARLIAAPEDKEGGLVPITMQLDFCQRF